MLYIVVDYYYESNDIYNNSTHNNCVFRDKNTKFDTEVENDIISNAIASHALFAEYWPFIFSYIIAIYCINCIKALNTGLPFLRNYNLLYGADIPHEVI